jgi:hypothetical protein
MREGIQALSKRFCCTAFTFWDWVVFHVALFRIMYANNQVCELELGGVRLQGINGISFGARLLVA